MTPPPPSRAPGRTARRFAMLAVLVAMTSVAAWLVVTRHTSRVTLRPGESAVVELDVPMDRFAGPQYFAKERGLPVTCVIAPSARNGPGVALAVLETSHIVRRLRATVHVAVAPGTRPGRRTYRAGFTIADETDWPRPKIVVDVTP